MATVVDFQPFVPNASDQIIRQASEIVHRGWRRALLPEEKVLAEEYAKKALREEEDADELDLHAENIAELLRGSHGRDPADMIRRASFIANESRGQRTDVYFAKANEFDKKFPGGHAPAEIVIPAINGMAIPPPPVIPVVDGKVVLPESPAIHPQIAIGSPLAPPLAQSSDSAIVPPDPCPYTNAQIDRELLDLQDIAEESGLPLEAPDDDGPSAIIQWDDAPADMKIGWRYTARCYSLFVQGRLKQSPSHLGALTPDVVPGPFVSLNEMGFITVDSQPGGSEEFENPRFGKGIEWQREYIFGFVPKWLVESVFETLKREFPTCEVVAVESKGVPTKGTVILQHGPRVYPVTFAVFEDGRTEDETGHKGTTAVGDKHFYIDLFPNGLDKDAQTWLDKHAVMIYIANPDEKQRNVISSKLPALMAPFFKGLMDDPARVRGVPARYLPVPAPLGVPRQKQILFENPHANLERKRVPATNQYASLSLVPAFAAEHEPGSLAQKIESFFGGGTQYGPLMPLPPDVPTPNRSLGPAPRGKGKAYQAEKQKAIAKAKAWWAKHPGAQAIDQSRTAKTVVRKAKNYTPSKNDFSGVDTRNPRRPFL